MVELLRNIIRLFRGEVSTNKLVKKGLIVGDNFSRQGNCIIDPPHCWLIEIGNNVTLASGVYILAHDASTKKILGYAKIGNVKIGDNVFIGAKSIILPNVNIGNNVIVGAGSVLTKDIPNNSVVAGNPAQMVCSIEEYQRKNESKMTKNNVFSDEYTMRKNISIEKKKAMKKELMKGIGFVE